MAGYVHGKTRQNADPVQRAELLQRIQDEQQRALEEQERVARFENENAKRKRLIEKEAAQVLDLKLRKVKAQKRMEAMRLEALLKVEHDLATGTEADKELARIQAAHPQPPGIGAARMRLFFREEDAYKAEKLTRRMGAISYGIAA